MENEHDFMKGFQQESLSWLPVLAKGGSIGAFLENMSASVKTLFSNSHVLCLVQDGERSWHRVYCHDPVLPLLDEKGSLKCEPPAISTFAQSPSRSVSLSSDLCNDPKWLPWKEFYEQCGIKQVAMSSVYYDGSIYLFLVFSNQPENLLTSLKMLVDNCAHWLQAGLVREHSDRLLLEDGHRDPETGLLRKYSFEHSFEMVLKDSRRHFLRVAVLSLILSPANCGANALELRALAEAMMKTVRDNDLIARYDEREFVMGIRIRHMEDAEVVADKLLKAMLSADFKGKSLISEGITIGISFYPEHSTLEDLYKAAVDASRAVTTGSGYRLEYHGDIYKSSSEFYNF